MQSTLVQEDRWRADQANSGARIQDKSTCLISKGCPSRSASSWSAFAGMWPPLSYRHLGEMMDERGACVDHTSIKRWAIRLLPLIEKLSRKNKRQVGGSWRMDETDIKVKSACKYLLPRRDKDEQTVVFLLTVKRDAAAPRRFFDNVIRKNRNASRRRRLQAHWQTHWQTHWQIMWASALCHLKLMRAEIGLECEHGRFQTRAATATR